MAAINPCWALATAAMGATHKCRLCLFLMAKDILRLHELLTQLIHVCVLLRLARFDLQRAEALRENLPESLARGGVLLSGHRRAHEGQEEAPERIPRAMANGEMIL